MLKLNFINIFICENCVGGMTKILTKEPNAIKAYPVKFDKKGNCDCQKFTLNNRVT